MIPFNPGPACQGCGRELAEGESVWADDWTVITPEGPRRETRYMCDDCAEDE